MAAVNFQEPACTLNSIRSVGVDNSLRRLNGGKDRSAIALFEYLGASRRKLNARKCQLEVLADLVFDILGWP